MVQQHLCSAAEAFIARVGMAWVNHIWSGLGDGMQIVMDFYSSIILFIARIG